MFEWVGEWIGEAIASAGGCVDEVAAASAYVAGVSEMVESSSKRLCSATGVPSEESVIHTDKSDKNTVLG